MRYPKSQIKTTRRTGSKFKRIWFIPRLAYPKATATSVVEMTKAAVEQFGRTTCPVTEELSKSSVKRAEDACHKLLFVWVLAIFVFQFFHVLQDSFLLFPNACPGFRNMTCLYQCQFRGFLCPAVVLTFLCLKSVTSSSTLEVQGVSTNSLGASRKKEFRIHFLSSGDGFPMKCRTMKFFLLALRVTYRFGEPFPT